MKTSTFRLFNVALALNFFIAAGLIKNTVADNKPRTVNHYVEGNISASYVATSGQRIGNLKPFSPGLHIAHGSNITPVHALVMSYGKDFIATKKGDDGSLTEVTFFLRRYMPKYSTPKTQLYSTIGSGYYRYERSGVAGALENAGIIFGLGLDFVLSDKLRLGLEADYRGFTIKQFGNDDIDLIRPFTLFIGIKYFYLSTQY